MTIMQVLLSMSLEVADPKSDVPRYLVRTPKGDAAVTGASMELIAHCVEVNLCLRDPHIRVLWPCGSERWEFTSSARTRLLRVVRHFTGRKPPEGDTLAEALVAAGELAVDRAVQIARLESRVRQMEEATSNLDRRLATAQRHLHSSRTSQEGLANALLALEELGVMDRGTTAKLGTHAAPSCEELMEKLRGSARPLTAPEAPRKPTTGRYWLASMPAMTTFDSYPEALEAAQASALSNPGRPFLICSVHSEVEYKRDGDKHLLSW